MNNHDFDELAGRIEGIARAYQVLVMQLSKEGVLDGQRLQADLRIYADAFQTRPDAHPAAGQAMKVIADNLLRDSFHLRGKSKEEIEVIMESIQAPDETA